MSWSVGLSGAETFCGLSFPLPAAPGCLQTKRDPSVSRHTRRMPAPPRCQCWQVMLSGHGFRCPRSVAWASFSCQFSVEKVFGDTAVHHPGDLASASVWVRFTWRYPCPLKHIVGGYLVSSRDTQDAPPGSAWGRSWVFFLASRAESMLHCCKSRVLHRLCTPCSLVNLVSFLFDQSVFVSRESVVATFPMRLLISVSGERLSDIIELKNTNSWTASSS